MRDIRWYFCIFFDKGGFKGKKFVSLVVFKDIDWNFGDWVLGICSLSNFFLMIFLYWLVVVLIWVGIRNS